MPTTLVRALLFVSSYFPLACICALLYYGKHLGFALCVLSCGLLGMVVLFVFLHRAREFSGLQLVISDVRRLDAEAMSYLVTYVVPFLALPSESWERGVALSVFFVVLSILYVNSNMIHINPLLNVVGYHIYEITVPDGDVHALVTRRRIRRGEMVTVARLGEDIFLEK